jgi:hypothetical protein
MIRTRLEWVYPSRQYGKTLEMMDRIEDGLRANEGFVFVGCNMDSWLGHFLVLANQYGYTVKIKPGEWVALEKVKDSQSF